MFDGETAFAMYDSMLRLQRNMYADINAVMIFLFFCLHKKNKSTDKKQNVRSNGRGDPSSNTAGGGGSAQGGGVSVWRQLLVANEWNRLGTRRRVSPALSLVFMAFVLGGSGLRYNATPQPALHDKEVTRYPRVPMCLFVFRIHFRRLPG